MAVLYRELLRGGRGREDEKEPKEPKKGQNNWKT
jgi:hypothetical protein